MCTANCFFDMKTASYRLLGKAKFLLGTQGICHHTGRMNAPVERLTSSMKKKTTQKQDGEGSGPSIKLNKALVIFLFLR